MSKSIIAMLVMLVVLAGALIIPITQMSRWDPELKRLEETKRAEAIEHSPDRIPKPGEPQTVYVLDNAAQLQSEFNVTKGQLRFLAILSPSDNSCRQAAEALQQGLLEQYPGLDMTVYVIWIRRQGSDTLDSAREASGLLPDQRVSQYYGSDNAAAYIADIMGYPGESAWNIVMQFGGDAYWEPELPQPSWYVHQLGPEHWLGSASFARGNDLRNALSARGAELAGWSF